MSWIKVEYTLLSKPEVMTIADSLEISEHQVVGHLVAFWCWVDANVSLDCPAVIGTKRGLDRVCGRDGMVDALISVNWLEFDGERFSVPNIDRHLSKGAKQRAVEARKKNNQRSRPVSVPLQSRSCPGAIGTSAGPDKIREEKKRKVNTDTDKQGDPEFDQFWNIYPHKTAKKRALKAWQTALKETDAQTIIRAAEEFARASKGKELQYIKHPATWLNDGSWEDVPVKPRDPYGKEARKEIEASYARGETTHEQLQEWYRAAMFAPEVE